MAFWNSASGATLEDMRRENSEANPEEVLYRTGMGGLANLQAQQTQRMAAARAPQEQAVSVLGQLANAPAVGQVNEAAQARAMVAARTPYGKAAAPEAAILGGQIGAAQAAQAPALAQEAAQRQAAYMQGIGALGAGAMSEAEERRRAEAAMLQDLTARYGAAMQQAAIDRERDAADRQRNIGLVSQAVSLPLAFVKPGAK
jgi:hypothetical protein